jgi:RimJ/RimL family protein N-acetyltransferase
MEKLGMRMEAHFVENEWVKGEWQSDVTYAMLDRERASIEPESTASGPRAAEP